jgi:cytochrome c551/c552
MITHGALARRVARARSSDAALRRSSRSASIVGCHQPRAKSVGPGAVRAGKAWTSSVWLGLRHPAQISAAGPAVTPG